MVVGLGSDGESDLFWGSEGRSGVLPAVDGAALKGSVAESIPVDTGEGAVGAGGAL